MTDKELEQVKARAAAEHGLNPDLGRYLRGNTLAEIQADAAALTMEIKSSRQHVAPLFNYDREHKPNNSKQAWQEVLDDFNGNV